MKLRYSFENIAVYVAMLLVVAGCSVGKNYQRPSVDLPVSYSLPEQKDSSLARITWKAFYGDTTLNRLIDEALRHNFDLQVAVKRIAAYEAYAKQARVAWLPAFSAQALASTNNPSQNSLNGVSLENFLGVSHIEDYSLGANLSWELDVWGKIRRQKEAALGDYLETYEARRAIETSLVAQVAEGYYNLLMMDAQLTIARHNANLSDSIVQMIQLQKTAGEVTELAVQQAMAQQQDAAILIPQLEQAIALQENGLKLLTGTLPGTIARNTLLEDVVMEDSLTTGVPADLLKFRPDVRAREHALRAANARVGVAQANMYPSLNITASGGLNAFKASNWFNVPASLFGTAAGSLTQPIFQRRALKTQLEVARVERDQRVIEFRQSVISAVHDVTNALIKLEKLEVQQEVATARANNLDQAVRNAQLLFRSGMADYLEVISAQSRALQAELEKATITKLQLSARVELYASLGGGWQ